MFADCLTFSISLSFMLSMLSELAAARMVIPFKMVTTISVFKLVVKNVFKLAAFKASSTFYFFGSRHVSHKIKFLSIYRVRRSLNLEAESKTPESKTGVKIYSPLETN